MCTVTVYCFLDQMWIPLYMKKFQFLYLNSQNLHMVRRNKYVRLHINITVSLFLDFD